MRPYYWWRRLWLWVSAWPEPACFIRECPENRVGFSRFCRRHTDEVLGGTYSPELAAIARSEGWKPRAAVEVGETDK